MEFYQRLRLVRQPEIAHRPAVAAGDGDAGVLKL
jgi:hypothetical protein